MSNNRPTGFEAFHWPEFQAFAKRLKMSVDQSFKKITIEMDTSQYVKITTETQGRDSEDKP